MPRHEVAIYIAGFDGEGILYISQFWFPLKVISLIKCEIMNISFVLSTPASSYLCIFFSSWYKSFCRKCFHLYIVRLESGREDSLLNELVKGWFVSGETCFAIYFFQQQRTISSYRNLLLAWITDIPLVSWNSCTTIFYPEQQVDIWQKWGTD